MSNDDEYEEEDHNASFLVLFLVSAVSFWLQAVITEERFVPALNVISKRLKISDDVAGATLMAAGASSPELMAALLSIFITHSALGMGTIVGSEIFNQLVISAGAILAVRNNHIKLDPIIVMREITFYALSLMFLMITLSDRRPVDDDDVNHIYITVTDGVTLVCCYCAYVIVCANFDTILNTLKVDIITEDSNNNSYECFYNAFEVQQKLGKQNLILNKRHAIPFVRSLYREPTSNFDLLSTKDTGEQSLNTAGSFVTEVYSKSNSESFDSDASCHRNFRGRLRLFCSTNFVLKLEPIKGIDDVQVNVIDDSLSCHLWQQSSFYDKARIDINAWHLRWFTFTCNRMISVQVRAGNETLKFIYPSFDTFQVDEAHLLLKIITVDSKKEYIFLAPSERILSVVVRKFEDMLQQPSIEVVENYDEKVSAAIPEEYAPLIAMPESCSLSRKIFHVILFPLKALIHYTIPDVRNGSITLLHLKAIVSIVVSIIFLVFSSFAMVTSLESLAQKLDIPEEIIGATISAAGTSLPNFVSSQVAARQGLSNMAISNVFGSNTFNILVGLGLPWLLYAATNGGTYNELREERITESLAVMVIALLVFLIILLSSGFNLYLWHSYLLLGMYVLFVILSIGQCYV